MPAPATAELSDAARLIARWCLDTNTPIVSLAHQAGVPVPWLRQILCGGIRQPGSEHLKMLAEATGLSLDTLLADRRATPERAARGGVRMSDVLARIESGANHPDGRLIGEARRAEIVQHIRRLKTLLGRPLDAIPASPAYLRRRMKGWNYAAFGTTKRMMEKIRSSINVALEIAGTIGPIRQITPLRSESWQRLIDSVIARDKELALKGPVNSAKLKPLARYCDARGIGPRQMRVDDIFALSELRAGNTLSATFNPAKERRTLISLWNRLSADIEGWPGPLPKTPRDLIRMPLKAFPESLQADFEHFKKNRGVRDPEKYDMRSGNYLEVARAIQSAKTSTLWKPLRDPSVATYLDTARWAASAMVRSGFKTPDEIRSLADIATIEGAVRLLKNFDARHCRDHQSSVRANCVAHLSHIALRWRPDISEEERKQFKGLVKGLDVKKTEMSEADRAIVDPFLVDPEQVARLVSLPIRLVVGAERARRETGKVRIRAALDVEAAVHLMLLCLLPERLNTIAQTEIKNIQRSTFNPQRAHIVWPGAVVKTNQPHRVEVAGWRLELLDIYLTHYRPALCVAETDYLFPHRHVRSRRQHRQPGCLAKQLKSVVLREIGVKVRHHLWRKIMGGFLFHKTQDEKVLRALLGHGRNSSSTRLYVDQLRTLWASATLDRIMAAMIEAQSVPAGFSLRSVK